MRYLPWLLACVVAVSCKSQSQSTPRYAVGGYISGFQANDANGLAITLNGGETLTPYQDGPYHFTNQVSAGSPYAVTLASPSQTAVCSVANGQGIIKANVFDANVTCVAGYTISVTVHGLSGTLVLADNGNNVLTATTNGNYTLPPLATGTPYNLTVATPPATQACVITQGATGTIARANVSNVAVYCVNQSATGYSVGGTVSGLVAGSSVTLQNAIDTLTVSTNGNFTISQHLVASTDYNITITQGATGELCGVLNGNGVILGNDIIAPRVVCVPNPHSLGGVVTGLQGGSLQLAIHNGSNREVNTNGNFVVSAAVPYGSMYQVVAVAQPAGQVCVVSNGSGTMPDADVLNIAIACGPGVTLGGSVSGLGSTGVLGLQNGSDTIYLNQTGAYVFDQLIPQYGNYNVTVASQPQGELCVLSGANATANGNNVTTVNVSCATNLNFTTGQSASLVLGQLTFALANANRGNSVPSSNTLKGPQGKAFGSSGGLFYQTDAGNNRVLGYLTMPTIDGANADFALGQTSLANYNAGNDANSVNGPASVSGSATLLAITDRRNHRVMIYNGNPQTFSAANAVVGQTGFSQSSSGCTASNLQGPRDAIIVNGNLLVADTLNNRVLIFNPVPVSNNQAAAAVLGQTNMTSCSASTPPNQGSMNAPTGLWSDGNRLAVADANNNRVLLYNNLNAVNTGQNADVVLGQAAFNTQIAAGGTAGLSDPESVASDGRSLFVSDSHNNRVLIYTPLPTTSGAAATAVLGQTDFTGVACNQAGSSPNATSMCYPEGISVFGVSLVVSDTNNNRALIFETN